MCVVSMPKSRKNTLIMSGVYETFSNVGYILYKLNMYREYIPMPYFRYILLKELNAFLERKEEK